MAAPSTQFEIDGGVTDNDTETQFLETVAADTEAVLTRAGISDEGRPIHRADIGNADGTTWTIMPLAHADEPAGREAALAFFRDLAYSEDEGIVDYLAEHRVVLLTPQNPDGLANSTRNTPQGDINKDHLTFNTAPARVVQETLRDIDPHMVLDAHERLKDQVTDLEYFPTGTLAVHKAIRSVSEDVLAHLVSGLHDAGYTAARYPVPGRISGREAAALHHCVGLLLETYTHDEGGLPHRIAVYERCLNLLREWHANNASALAQAKDDSKAAAERGEPRPYPLQTGDLAEDGQWPVTKLPTHLRGYRITGPLRSELMDAYGVIADGDFVPLSQTAYAVVPLLFDEASDNRAVSAERVPR